jgi:hypothetical protein
MCPLFLFTLHLPSFGETEVQVECARPVFVPIEKVNMRSENVHVRHIPISMLKNYPNNLILKELLSS